MRIHGGKRDAGGDVVTGQNLLQPAVVDRFRGNEIGNLEDATPEKPAKVEAPAKAEQPAKANKAEKSPKPAKR